MVTREAGLMGQYVIHRAAGHGLHTAQTGWPNGICYS
jgi:hypothetical protein